MSGCPSVQRQHRILRLSPGTRYFLHLIRIVLLHFGRKHCAECVISWLPWWHDSRKDGCSASTVSRQTRLKPGTQSHGAKAQEEDTSAKPAGPPVGREQSLPTFEPEVKSLLVRAGKWTTSGAVERGRRLIQFSENGGADESCFQELPPPCLRILPRRHS